MVDENDKVINDNKEIKTKKKTLVLSGLSVNRAKLTDVSEKNIRGRSVSIEIKGKKKIEDIKPVLNAQESKLTQEEKEKRSKLANQYDKMIDKEEDSDKNLSISSLQVVVKEPVLNKNKVDFDHNPESSEQKQSINNANYHKDKPTDIDFDDNIDSKDKKSKIDKKKLLETEEKKKANLNNWKNLYTYQIKSDEEDTISDDDLIEEEIEEVVEAKPKYISTIKRKNKHYKFNTEKLKKTIELDNDVVVKDLALALAEKHSVVLKMLSKLGVDVGEGDTIDRETAVLLAEELGHTVKLINANAIEDEFLKFQDNLEDLKERPPVVAIMGHVDHGKTTLLDIIRKTNVADKESGGITQHIGAYQIKTSSGKVITFLDTPGHEAFSQIRARGSKITDIAIIVVAADDGVKPQTIEALNHAKLANVPIIIAINKIDKPDKNVQKVKTELLQQNIVLEDLGGDVLSVEISAKTNVGIDKLLETILLQTEMLELKSNYKALAKGSVIEVKVVKGLGCFASVLVERGELKIGDLFVCGNVSGKVKVMIDDKGERLKVAYPSQPIEISGFEDVVQAGDDFIVVPNEGKLNELLEYRRKKSNNVNLNTTKNIDIGNLLSQDYSDVKTLSVIIKTDAQGSLEAILGSIEKIQHKDVNIKIIHSAVGEISESDVMMAKIGKAVLIGFHSRANAKAKDLAKRDSIEIRYHSIIYNLIDDIKLIMSGMLDPDIVENIIGYAEVREVFNVTKIGKIAGCFVTEGVLKRSAFVRVLRKNIVIHDGVLSQLKRFKDDVKEVKHTFECGVMVENYNDIEPLDMIECYEKVEVKQELS